MRRQHNWAPDRNLLDVIDKLHALRPERINDDLIVNNFVIAVHRRLERTHHPGQSFDRHLDSSAKPTWFSKQHSID